MAVIVEISVVPLGTGTPSVSSYVAACVREVKRSKIAYQLTPMGTILEGELEEVLALVRRLHEIPFDLGAVRVSTSIKIDDRRDQEATMEGKVVAVQNKLEP